MNKHTDKKKMLIAGDIMLDIYHFGKVSRISPEAPVPVFLEEGDVRMSPGGAANVAVNVAAIGIEADIFSVTGDDSISGDLTGILKDHGIDTKYIASVSDRSTTGKTRYIAQNNQQILRVDSEDTDDVDIKTVKRQLDNIEKRIDDYGLFLISDYKKGLLTEEITQSLINIAAKHSIPVFVDAKDKNISKYRNATLLKPNRKELKEITDLPVGTVDEVSQASMRLCRDASVRYVLTTLGADGMLLVDKDKVICSVKSAAREVYDVTGAGDTSIAYLAAEVLFGNSMEDAVRTANIAAGIQVAKVGTSVVTPEEVRAAIEKSGMGKTVFTNGCFDIIHAGHVKYLREARKLGDRLVVGLNSDESVHRLKGDSRPVNPLKDRIDVLSAFEFVDEVIPFEEDTPYDLIKKVRPDILVKGGDYEIKDIVGADLVRSWGGEVRTIPFVEGKSTTAIIEKIGGTSND